MEGGRVERASGLLLYIGGVQLCLQPSPLTNQSIQCTLTFLLKGILKMQNRVLRSGVLGEVLPTSCRIPELGAKPWQHKASGRPNFLDLLD